jgi:hypothetical protein
MVHKVTTALEIVTYCTFQHFKVFQGSIGSGMWGMDWIDLAQGRDRWQAVLNAGMNLRVS